MISQYSFDPHAPPRPSPSNETFNTATEELGDAASQLSSLVCEMEQDRSELNRELQGMNIEVDRKRSEPDNIDEDGLSISGSLS